MTRPCCWRNRRASSRVATGVGTLSCYVNALQSGHRLTFGRPRDGQFATRRSKLAGIRSFDRQNAVSPTRKRSDRHHGPRRRAMAPIDRDQPGTTHRAARGADRAWAGAGRLARARPAPPAASTALPLPVLPGPRRRPGHRPTRRAAKKPSPAAIYARPVRKVLVANRGEIAVRAFWGRERTGLHLRRRLTLCGTRLCRPAGVTSAGVTLVAATSRGLRCRRATGPTRPPPATSGPPRPASSKAPGRAARGSPSRSRWPPRTGRPRKTRCLCPPGNCHLTRSPSARARRHRRGAGTRPPPRRAGPWSPEGRG